MFVWFSANKSIWTTFTGGEDEDWAVHITTAFSITNTVSNVVSGFATDFLWEKVCGISFSQASSMSSLPLILYFILQFRFPRNKLLSLVFTFDAILYAILTGLSYGVPGNKTAQVLFLTASSSQRLLTHICSTR